MLLQPSLELDLLPGEALLILLHHTSVLVGYCRSWRKIIRRRSRGDASRSRSRSWRWITLSHVHVRIGPGGAAAAADWNNRYGWAQRITSRVIQCRLVGWGGGTCGGHWGGRPKA
jgi:hypothetical protein